MASSYTGGVVIKSVTRTERFKRDYKKLMPEIQTQVVGRLKDLLKDPMPARLRFEKLTGERNPDKYTIHATHNHSHKISMEIDGTTAILRRVGTHKEIDHSP